MSFNPVSYAHFKRQRREQPLVRKPEITNDDLIWSQTDYA